MLDGIFNGIRAPYALAADPTRNAVTGTDQNDRLFGSSDITELPFSLPSIITELKNEEGQRIIELCLWLPSGIDMKNYCLCVSDDMKTLKFTMSMDPLMADAWGLHRDLVPEGLKMKKKERQAHVRVHHWNSVIDELRSENGQLPKFVAEVQLPEELCSKNFVRRIGKATPNHTGMLVIDALVEDAKVPAIEPRRTFDLISGDDDPIVVDGNCRKKRG